MNVLRIFLAIPLALIAFSIAILLTLLMLVVFVTISPTVRFLMKDVCSHSKEYKVFELIVIPFNNCLEKIIGYLYQLRG